MSTVVHRRDATDASSFVAHGLRLLWRFPAEIANAFVHDLAADRVKHARLSLASWFNELVYPLFDEACFGEPI